MDSSNCNCCCGCQYSTPPWWVTMGFVPPYQQAPAPPNTLTSSGSPGQGQPPVPGFGLPPGTHGGQTGGGLGGLLGGILNPLGGLLGGLL